MFTQFQLQNFKPWKDTKKQRLAPLTVFFGANSAGKSSLSQFLLLLKQTVDSPDRQRVLHLGDRNSVTDLGTFHDLIYGHDESIPLEFLLAWDLGKPLTIHDPVSGSRFQGKHIAFTARILSAAGRLSVSAMNYQLTNAKKALSASMTAEEGTKKFRLELDNYKAVRNPGRSWPLPHPNKFYGFPDEAVAYYQNTGFLADLTLSMEQAFSNLYYVGPLRGYPERSYIWSGEQVDHVGWRGERAVEAILAARNRRIGRGYRKTKQPFEKVVARWLNTMNLISSFEVRAIAVHRKEYEVLIRRTRKGSSVVNLTDVGFGLSQVLPIIVQSFYAPKGSTIIFEQPEIHLHPRVQADLADLFIEAIHSREGGDDRNNQLIVESHSEHFLRRLQRRIAEEAIKPEDVAIYFCEPGPSGSIMVPLDVDMFGNITNWPDHFFGDEAGDLVAMTEAAMRRQMGE